MQRLDCKGETAWMRSGFNFFTLAIGFTSSISPLTFPQFQRALDARRRLGRTASR